MQGSFSDLAGQVESYLNKKAITTHLPGLMYSAAYEEQPSDFSVYVAKKAFDLIPLFGYLEEHSGYATEVESASTYEMILAGEANDENAVNEMTGELIPSDMETEAMQQENAAALANAMQAENAAAGPAPSEQVDVSQIQEAQETTNQISMEKLNDYDYLINNFYVVDKTTTITSSQLNASQLLQENMGIAQDNSVPQILIYHTHSQESFVDSIPGDPSTTIVGVGEYLTTLLRDKYHFNVIHHTEVYDMIDGKLDRSKAYALAETSIAQILADNPSIEVVIDLHRDGVAEGTHLVTNINGKDTAQFMFFNGLSRTTKIGDISYLPNPYIQDNLAFSLQCQLKAAQYYPGVARKIYLKGYRYNMHFKPRSLLVECGAQTNTLQEEKNAMEPLADILHKVLTGS
ncbi:stage II sporulation protein P [Lachnospiraceae bacterium ASD3451]|uniref:Stage II sporulation protein P n=2 Tax=Diplocloster agilis TaxID=2850323 RepID=A0A949K005_9FIRM|nr:stage II sporulation protein P [Diplocloster agilis]MBU9745831.1 stage II sporulation protein P [Diplocloster agilis]